VPDFTTLVPFTTLGSGVFCGEAVLPKDCSEGVFDRGKGKDALPYWGLSRFVTFLFIEGNVIQRPHIQA